MKKFLSMIVMAVIAISFASCADDDEDKDSGGGTSVVQDGKISGKIENFNNEINGFRCYLSSTSKFILDVPVTNGSFSFTLPNPSYSDLRSFNYFEYGAGERLKISNDTARFVSIYFVGYPSSYRSYYLKLESAKGGSDWDAGDISVEFYYVDKDVKVTGDDVFEGIKTTYNLNLKKGWNKVLYNRSKNTWSMITGNIPSNMVWRLDSY